MGLTIYDSSGIPKTEFDPSPDFLDVYDNTGGQDLSGGATTVNLDTEANSRGSTFSLASDEVTVSKAVMVKATYSVSVDQTDGTSDRAIVRAWLELDDGSGYSEIAGTSTWMYSRFIPVGETSSTASRTIDLESTINGKLRLRAEQTAGVAGGQIARTLAEGSRLLVEVF